MTTTITVIKNTRKVSGFIQESNWLQRVYDLLSVYIHQKIYVHIETETHQEVLSSSEVKTPFDFEILRNIFARNHNDMICTIEVKNEISE